MLTELLKKQICFLRNKYRVRRTFPFCKFFSDEQLLGRYFNGDSEFFFWSLALNIVTRWPKLNLLYFHADVPEDKVFYYFKLFKKGTVRSFMLSEFLKDPKDYLNNNEFPTILRCDLLKYSEISFSIFKLIRPDIVIVYISGKLDGQDFINIGQRMCRYGYVFDSMFGCHYGVFCLLETINGFPAKLVELYGLSDLMPLACTPKFSEFRWPT